MKKSFLTRMVYSNGLWIVGLFILLLSVIGNGFHNLNPQIIHNPAFEKLSGLGVFGIKLDLILKNPLAGYVGRFLLLFGSALFLQSLSSEYRLIRVRSFFPFFIFCVFAATVIPAIPLDGSSLACFFFCWSCFRLFAACETGPINRAVFDASLLLAVASLFQSGIILILPIFWLVMGILQIFSFRSFMASIIGVLCVFWVAGGLSFIFEDYSFLIYLFRHMIGFELVDFASFTPAEIAYTSFLGLLMISAMLSFWPRQNLEKLHTRNYLNSILLLWFSLLALWLFSGNNYGFMLFLFCLSSLMAAHFFSLVDTRFSRSLFFLFLFLSLLVNLLLKN